MTTTTPTTTHPNIETVQRLYGAYGRGDMEAALADVADDVDWAAEASGDAVPWWGPHLGKSEVPRFFQEIASNVDVTKFDVLSHKANDDEVVSTIHWSFRVNATGKTATMYMQHWWKFADGKIVFFRGSEDSYQSAQAFS
jgi:ketosteroid isomerase-like protein